MGGRAAGAGAAAAAGRVFAGGARRPARLYCPVMKSGWRRGRAQRPPSDIQINGGGETERGGEREGGRESVPADLLVAAGRCW